MSCRLFAAQTFSHKLNSPVASETDFHKSVISLSRCESCRMWNYVACLWGTDCLTKHDYHGCVRERECTCVVKIEHIIKVIIIIIKYA